MNSLRGIILNRVCSERPTVVIFDGKERTFLQDREARERGQDQGQDQGQYQEEEQELRTLFCQDYDFKIKLETIHQC